MRLGGASAVALGTSFLLAAASTAEAAVVFSFTPSAAPAGATVTITSEGQAPGDERGGFELYLAPDQAVADALSGRRPRHPDLVRLGHFDGELAMGEQVRFTVPEVRAGEYVIVVHCPRCDGDGSTFSAVGSFKVTTGAALPYTGATRAELILFAAALTGAGGLLLLRARRLG